MILLHIFIEFAKISLFSFGGGYGTLPFIYYISNSYNWYSAKEIMQMIAVAAITPGAFGVNMATYTGFKVYGITGAIIATLALILPSYFLSVGIYKVLKKFKDSMFVKDLMETLRAVATGLMLAVVIQMLNQEILHISFFPFTVDFSIKAFIILCFSVLVYFLVKKASY